MVNLNPFSPTHLFKKLAPLRPLPMANPLGPAPLLYVPHCSSTMDLLEEHRRGGLAPDGCVITADYQWAGRGRQSEGRWISQPGLNLLCSIFLAKLPQRAPPLFLANIILETIRPYIGEGLKLKWPNDILIHDRKVAGILCDKRLDGFHIGIGINCWQRRFNFIKTSEVRESKNIRTKAAEMNFKKLGATSISLEREHRFGQQAQSRAPFDYDSRLSPRPHHLLFELLSVLAARRLLEDEFSPLHLLPKLWRLGKKVGIQGAGGPEEGILEGLGPGGGLHIYGRNGSREYFSGSLYAVD